MTRRQHMIMAWSLLALGRGFLYLPVHTGYGDFPLPLTYVFDVKHVWICGVIWMLIGVSGILTATWRRAPWWVEQAFWIGILGGVAGWGGMYVSALLIPGGTFVLAIAGELYLAIAYGIWATKNPTPPINEAWRQRRDRSTSRGE